MVIYIYIRGKRQDRNWQEKVKLSVWDYDSFVDACGLDYANLR